jgi:hypothetical protein
MKAPLSQQEKKKGRRSITSGSEDQPLFIQTVHAGLNSFQELTFPEFVVRRGRSIRGSHCQSMIAGSQVHELLENNRRRLSHIRLEVN